MTTYKDTDLREALRRKYADTPQLPSDFMNRMHKVAQPKPKRASTPLHYGRLGSLEQPLNVAAAPQRGANPHSRRRAGWGWVFSIAAALLIAFLIWPESHKETTTLPEVKPVVAETNPQPVPQPIVEEKKEEVLAEVMPAPQSVKKQRKAVRKQSAAKEKTALAQAEPITEAPAPNNYRERLSDASNPYLLATAQLQDLRSRGERLDREVAMLMQH